jgi:hypothetical protein
VSKLELLRKYFLFLIGWTAGYAAFRLFKQDEWQWDELFWAYAWAAVCFVIIGSINQKPDHG